MQWGSEHHQSKDQSSQEGFKNNKLTGTEIAPTSTRDGYIEGTIGYFIFTRSLGLPFSHSFYVRLSYLDIAIAP